jgi:2-hydroxychromene-2-carboxylate isomerase
MDHRPLLFFDLGSQYAYLAVERAERVLGVPPRLAPVLLGAIFRARGHGSWGDTPERAAQQAEIERRARSYGLPPVRWPPGWPPNTLAAMRAVVWAQRHGRGDAFARAAFRRAFADGADIGDIAVLADVAGAVGLAPAELEPAIATPSIKDELRERTEEALALGVRGVPTLAASGVLHYGDDRLEAAASACRPRPGSACGSAGTPSPSTRASG